MAKTTERFKVVASSEILVVEAGKSAVKVELQFGKEGKLPELVIAEMYNKDGEWCYTRSQVRMEASKENAKFLIDGINTVYKEASKVKKDAPKDGAVTISKLTDAEKAALLAELLKEAKLESVLTSKKVKK